MVELLGAVVSLAAVAVLALMALLVISVVVLAVLAAMAVSTGREPHEQKPVIRLGTAPSGRAEPRTFGSLEGAGLVGQGPVDVPRGRLRRGRS